MTSGSPNAQLDSTGRPLMSSPAFACPGQEDNPTVFTSVSPSDSKVTFSSDSKVTFSI
jgi:hypothetical protein